MRSRIRRVPSPALVISAIALIVAVGGGTFAIAALNNTKVKKIAKKQADRQIKKKAPRLSVNHARTAGNAKTASNANNLGGSPASAFEPATQWVLVAANGTTELAGSPGVSVDTGGTDEFTYVDFGRSVANRLLLLTSDTPSRAPTNGDMSATPCGGSSVPGGSTCSIDDDANHVLVRKNTAQPFYLGVFG